MGNSLEHLLAEGVISEIITRLKSGKEADVYAVRQGGRVIAAKVYKDRAHRSFKNNSAYKEGRQVRNSRSQRAMDRGSKFGKDAAEDAWKATEANTLYKLHAAGVRVPTPVMFLEGVLFMELVLDAHGQAAPRLIDSELSVEDANGAYRDMLTQLVRILSCDLIHGDLSPYNVLWAVTGPTIIDFPQCVSASHSSNSENFFLRDARNILGHFATIDPSLRSRSGDAAEIWRAYVRRELSPDFVPSGRPARPEPRPHFVEPTSARPTGHRGPPPHPAPGAQNRGPSGARGPHSAPSAPSSNSPRNAPATRSAFASAPKPQPAPGLSRGGPRRPDVIVLTRRSPKASAESTAEPGSGRPRSAVSQTDRQRAPLFDASSNSSPRFAPSPRADSNSNTTSRFNPRPTSIPNSDPNPNRSSNPNLNRSPNPNPNRSSNPNPNRSSNPNPNRSSNPNPNRNSNPNPNPNPNRSSNPNPNRSSNPNRDPNSNPGLVAGPADAQSPTHHKRRRRRRARTPSS